MTCEIRRLAWPLSVMVALASISGCSPTPAPAPARVAADTDRDADDHDHGHDHDHEHDDDHSKPETIEAALAELGKVVESVKKSLAAKDLDEADGHVHMVGHLVDDLHGLVKAAKLPAETEAAAKKALDELYECFDDLDTKLHSADEDVKKAIDYAEHEPRVEAAIKALGDLAKSGQAAASAAAKDIDE